MSTLNGLPAHVLLVHAVVVLLPLSAALLVLCAVRPSVRARLAGPNALLALGVLALVPLTTGAGEWLEKRVADTQLVRDHVALGDTALLVAIPVAVLAVVLWWRFREETRPGRTYLRPGSQAVSSALVVLCVLAAGAALYDTYRIGDSGARASWEDGVTAQPGDG